MKHNNGPKLAEQLNVKLIEQGLGGSVEIKLGGENAKALRFVAATLGIDPEQFAVEILIAPRLDQFLSNDGSLEEEFRHLAFSEDASQRLANRLLSDADKVSPDILQTIGYVVEQAQREFEEADQRREEASERLSRLIALERSAEAATEATAA